jgi:hypothetical protein
MRLREAELDAQGEVGPHPFFLANHIAELGFAEFHRFRTASAWVTPWWAMVSRMRAAAGFERGLGILRKNKTRDVE